MKLSPFNLYLNSLARGPVRLGYLEKDEALDRLKKLTGEDFGTDVDEWRAWGEAHPKVAQGQATYSADRPEVEGGE